VRRPTVALLTSISLLFLAGCGEDLSGAIEAEALECPPGEEGCPEIRPVGPGGELEIEMGSFFFEEIGGLVVTGEVDVTAINVSGDYHNIEFLGAPEGSFMGGADGDAVAGAAGNETDEGVVELFPGEVTVICNVPGHRAAGMEDTITVYATVEEAEAAAEEDDPADDM
jgi:plastocyanin